MNMQREATCDQQAPLFTCITSSLCQRYEGGAFTSLHVTQERTFNEIPSHRVCRVVKKPDMALFSMMVPKFGGMNKELRPTDPDAQALRHHSASEPPSPCATHPL